MSLDVIGAGLGRTGTLSLKRALEELGFAPCYHMEEVIADPPKIEQWMAVADNPDADWDAIFRGYRATVDWPAASYWRQLAAAYPDAKLILSIRDSGKWFDSTQKTIFNRERLSGLPQPFLTMADRIVYSVMDMRITDRAHCIEVYERHNRDVIEGLPADRLLVFSADQGWGPLCDFLGCAVPGTPYPHVNKSESFEAVAQ